MNFIKFIIAAMIVATLSIPAMATSSYHNSTSWGNNYTENVTTNPIDYVVGISADFCDRANNANENTNTGKTKWTGGFSIYNNKCVLVSNVTDTDVLTSDKNYIISFNASLNGSDDDMYVGFYMSSGVIISTGSFNGYFLHFDTGGGAIRYKNSTGTTKTQIGIYYPTLYPKNYSIDTQTICTGLKLYQNGALLTTFPADTTYCTNGGTVAFQPNIANRIAIDNYTVTKSLTGNLTVWDNFGTGQQGSQTQFDYINSTGLYVDGYASSDNFTSNSSLILSNMTNSTLINILSTSKNQTQYVRAVLIRTLYSSPILQNIVTTDEISTPSCSNIATTSDLMFPVNVSECWSFTSGLTGSLNWTVNHVNNSYQTTDILNWTVPVNDSDISKNIYTIRADNGTNYTEWAVSTLSLSDAPDFFDDFSEGTVLTHNQTDIWNRTQENWDKLYDANSLINSRFLTAGYYRIDLTTINLVRGTYVYWEYFSDAGDIETNETACQVHGYSAPCNDWSEQVGFYPSNNTDYSQGTVFYPYLAIQNAYDEHLWIFSYGSVYDYRNVFSLEQNDYALQEYPVNKSGTKTSLGWHIFKLIIDENDEVYTYMDNEALYSTRGKLNRTKNNLRNFKSLTVRLVGTGVHPNMTLGLDGIQIYKNKYLFPSSNISYNATADRIELKYGNKSLDTNLSSINSTVNNASLFTYYPSNNTYQSFKPIRVIKGSKLRVVNETFKTPAIFLENSADIYVFNSTITNNSVWDFDYTSSSNTESIGGFGFVLNEGAQNITILNSTINNNDYGFSSAFSSIYIKNSQFTNMNSTFTLGQPRDSPKSVFEIENSSFDSTLSFNAIDGTSLSGYKPKQHYLSFQNINITNISSSNPNTMYNSSVVLKNPKYITVSTSNTSTGSASVTFAYYIDINVTNNNNVIPGASIIITNVNTSNNLFKPLNLQYYKDWYESGASPPIYEYIYEQGDIINHSIITGSDGHTPLPSNTTDSILLVQGQYKNGLWSNFTYNVNVNDSSKIYTNKNTSISNTGINTPIDITASTTIILNSSWYRPNPNTYQNTRTIQLPASTNWSILPDTTISVNASSDKNLTATWSGSATVLFNTTIPEWESQILYLKHDGVTVDTKTSNITGFVNFTYTGTNGDFNVSNAIEVQFTKVEFLGWD